MTDPLHEQPAPRIVLRWGLNGAVPAGAAAAWGARAILQHGFVDLVHDRMDAAPAERSAERDRLLKWLDKKALPWLRKEAKGIRPTDDDTHAFDDDRLHLRANANRSYGYLYIAAWIDGEPKPEGEAA